MGMQRLAAVEALFHAAVELPPENRESFLASRCSRDDELRKFVAKLLANHDAGIGDFLESPVLPAAIPSSSTAGLATSSRSPAFAAGDHLAGRYRVMQLLGQGGMGEVYEVWDDELSIPVALKTIRIDPSQEPEQAVRRLKQEALFARAVVHPNVCRVYDVGCHSEESAVWFLTMEVLRGDTLHDRLLTRGPFTQEEALPLVRQMTAGLEAAHQAGVVHGDFKSGNVMLVESPEGQLAVVTDFGLACQSRDRAQKGTGQRRTEPVGTPAYMAPEQVRGETPGPQADIYALGVVMFELVTGTLPFIGGTPWEAAMRRLDELPPSPREVVRTLDESWERVILRCLARDPEARFASPEAIANALAGLEARPEMHSPSARSAHRRRSLVPLERDAFFGRETELRQLAFRLAGGARLVTLMGAAGIGKTRLAVHYAREQLPAWPGGVWFCDLAEARSLEGIASAVAKSLGVQLGRADPVTQLGHAIASRKHCLVILDNFEQVVELAQETVGQWIHRAKSAKFAVTSRERLNLSGEEVLRVEPLAAEPGLALFLERASRLCPGLTLEAHELAAAKEAVRLSDGMPLAIELAAARMRVMSITTLVEGMQKRFRLLTGGKSTRHETLAAAINASWQLLQPWEKAAWAQASVFEGGFTLEAAENVIDLSTWPETPWVVDVVQSLVDKSLIQIKAPEGRESSRMRFGMLMSLQEFARKRLEEDGAIPEGASTTAVRAAEERHGAWYARFGTDDAMDSLDQEGGATKRRDLHRELDNLVTACRRALVRVDGSMAAATYRAASDVLDRRGPFATAIRLGEEVLASEMEPMLRARALLTLGTAKGRSGLPEASRSHLEDALAIFRTIDHRSGQGYVLGNLGIVASAMGKYDEAAVHFEQAMAIHREVGNRRMEGTVLGNLALTRHVQGQLQTARRLFEAAIAIHIETGNRRSEAITFGCLGNLHLHQARLEEAGTCFQRSVDIHRELDDRPFEGVALCDLGNLHHMQGQVDLAQSDFENSLEIHREVGNRPAEGIVLGNLANVFFERGWMEKARLSFEAALAINREVGDRRSEGINLGNFANLHFAAGRIEEARSCHEDALVILRQVGYRRYEGVVLGHLSLVYLEQQDPKTARDALIRGEAILREVADPVELAKLLCSRAVMEAKTGCPGKAAATLLEIEALTQQEGVRQESALFDRLARTREAVRSCI